MNRRHFLNLLLTGAASAAVSCRTPRGLALRRRTKSRRFLFVSAGRTAIMNSDGTGLRFLEFDVRDQTTWQPGPFFSDGRRLLLLSMEKRRDGPGRPFDEYYTQTPTHIWIHDLESGELTEVADKERIAPFYTPALLIGERRILVQIVKEKTGQIWNMNLDGTDKREFTRRGDGFPYGLALSPDETRVAFHTAGPSPHSYRIWTSDVDGSNRMLVAGHPEHLYFGPVWSPDGRWLAYQDCLFKQDPAHDWADLCVNRPDGSDHQELTRGQAQWFGAAYGNPQQRGSGTNMISWTRDGCVLFSRKLPGSKVAWEYQANRPDVDHFNRDWRPDLARGGTEICKLNPRGGSITCLTHPGSAVWDFRASESPDGRQIIFCRAETKGLPAIWVMDADGRHQRELAQGFQNRGADHPRWLP